MGRIEEHFVEACAITSGRHHFFGYYDKFPWDASGRYHLALEVDFMDRLPAPADEAVVGMADLHDDNRFIPLDRTTAWHTQQANMLQWWGAEPDGEIVYNVRQGDAYKARVRDVHGGEARDLPRPIYHLTADGAKAVCLDFSRIHTCRVGYGYCGIPDAFADVPAPDEIGVWVMDMHTGEERLLTSLADLAAIDPPDDFDDGTHYLNHAQWNTDGTRLFFFHIWNRPGDGGRYTRLYTVNADGTELFLTPFHEMVSHYDWRDEAHILAYARMAGAGDHFFLLRDRSDEYEVIGRDVLTSDGHCSFSPDRQWMASDTYPRGEPPERTLYLYRMPDGPRIDLGRFGIDGAARSGPLRCDLHPRWSRDGTRLSIDSVHQGSRQVYLLDLDGIV